MTMTLADFTSPGLVVPHLRGPDATAVIQELSQALHREQRVMDLLPFYHAALNREFMASTDIEAGMAFPHARLLAVKELSFALGRMDEPLAWGSKSNGAVRLVFLSAVPGTDSTQYLALISGLVRLARDGRQVENLLAARDSFQMLEVLKQIELRTGKVSSSARKGDRGLNSALRIS